MPALAADALRAAAALVVAALPAPRHDPDKVRETVREVLSRPEYRPRNQSLLDRVSEFLLELLAKALAGLTGGGTGAVIGVVLSALILAGIGYLITKFARGISRDPEETAEVPAPPLRPATDWLAEAEHHERAGNWRDGLRCRYRALVASLGARGVVDEVPGTTAGEYRRQVAGNAPTVATEFAGATELFEAAWYGNRETGPPEAERFRELADRVLTGTAA